MEITLNGAVWQGYWMVRRLRSVTRISQSAHCFQHDVFNFGPVRRCNPVQQFNRVARVSIASCEAKLRAGLPLFSERARLRSAATVESSRPRDIEKQEEVALEANAAAKRCGKWPTCETGCLCLSVGGRTGGTTIRGPNQLRRKEKTKAAFLPARA